MVIDQGKVGAIISEIFDINHDYVGSLFSNIAKVCPIGLKMNAIPWNIKMKSPKDSISNEFNSILFECFNARLSFFSIPERL